MNKEIVYLTTSQVAERFGVDSSTIRRWVINGLLTPAHTTLGGHHRFTGKDIEEDPGGSQRLSA